MSDRERTGATGETHETLPPCDNRESFRRCLLSSVSPHLPLSRCVMRRGILLTFTQAEAPSRGVKEVNPVAACNSCDSRVTWRASMAETREREREKEKGKNEREDVAPLRRESNVGIKSLRIPVHRADSLFLCARARARTSHHELLSIYSPEHFERYFPSLRGGFFRNGQ